MKMFEELEVVLDQGAFPPKRAYSADAGLDIFTPMDLIVPAHGSETVDTGVHVRIPEGYVGFLKSKSGLNVKYGITGTGVIDAGYSGSIVAKLYNNSSEYKTFVRGEKIIQLVLLPIATPRVVIVDSFAGGERGENGFGSTGR